MSGAKAGGLRVRLAAGLFGAGLLSMALLAIVLLLEVRDALYARRLADARERLQAAVAAAAELCPTRDPLLDRSCRAELASVLGLAGVSSDERACEASVVRGREALVLCEATPSGGALRLSLPVEPVRAQLLALDARLLVALAATLLLLVLLSSTILERGVVRRLSGVDAALQKVGAEEAALELLPEGGDALGRLGAAVNRLADRLREERARTQGQIVSLQEANRRLAEEEQALRQAREDLTRSERLSSVGRLAAGVAHEVGNPLSAVIAYAALLRERLERQEGGAESAELAARIEREGARVDRILRDLLDLARPHDLRLEATDLRRALQTARALVEPQPSWREAGCAVADELPADLPPVLAEDHYLVQVLVNLLDNAAKAGARTIRVAGRAGADAVELEVADDGRGLAPEHVERLFEPFFTTAPPGKGTGLGLALCHATMERLGGSISARAAGTGKGAAFLLRFRRAPRPG